jgi:hypothetical protein
MNSAALRAEIAVLRTDYATASPWISRRIAINPARSAGAIGALRPGFNPAQRAGA